ncbi:NADPH-dependent 2,4-dienoyl-CoA reductase/sulfur reductase-like enzyme [Herbaspirillum sp. Sphag1AN]|uniref:NAD(P)/FAD-dependent oxidoreductase n=1 Tax=unclassified Herbaspirillum TaxID=2624150 RepID=UPI00161E043E|nr:MULTISPECIES: NAD(P)/FAD-dependent oxidoreductase [unclassified Herbaspirillum]MBB3212450.1 NADPH-dependent 2,4-dienoyl-CoA reductase/sulfur reductase-like enzyme [Herbaspirillum sp. Sphag1AN]MBB3245451.1 NADPH-dependent 2,4-dienoyl-CoA reductase/sulfur reductase-like enzyme [Herbaspirillum sp. Sphag64]
MTTSTLTFTHDLIVIGSGPAGMAAALTGAAQGLKTLLLDEQPRPGGQIYRNITAVAPSVAALLGPDYRHGKTLSDRLSKANVERRFGAMVWEVAPDLTVTVQQDGRSSRVRAPQLIAATGAMERPSPIPGWTLPGVLNAGAAQIAMKSAAIVPQGRVVLVGAGPLLLLVACQLLDAGASIAGIVETSPRENRQKALAHIGAALLAPSYLLKGMRMLWRLRRAAIPLFSAVTEVRIEGTEHAEAVVFTANGIHHRLDADVVLLHHGVVPNTQLSRQLRVAHDWDDTQVAWRPVVDAWGQTSLTGFRIAGDGSGIAGARAAEASGALAALGAASVLGRLNEDDHARLTQVESQKLTQHLRIRPFLDALYRPPQWLANPSDETIVCRCEEVSAGRIREMARLGCQGPNQTKFFSRCGMGPCQGRMCGLTVTQILSTELQKSPAEVGAYHIRTPLKPVSLGSLASLASLANEKETQAE